MPVSFSGSSYAASPRLRAPDVVWAKTASTPLEMNDWVSTLKTWINRAPQDSFWNAEVQALIATAQRMIERWATIAIAPSTWVGTAPYLLPQMTIIRRPFIAVDSIQYVDRMTGEVATVDPALYQSATVSQMCGQLWVADGGDWPDAATRQDAFRITVRTGWPLNSEDPPKPIVPEDLLHGIMMTVAALDANRGDGSISGGHLDNTVFGATHASAPMMIPNHAQAVMAPFRYMGLYVA